MPGLIRYPVSNQSLMDYESLPWLSPFGPANAVQICSYRFVRISKKRFPELPGLVLIFMSLAYHIRHAGLDPVSGIVWPSSVWLIANSHEVNGTAG
jgi:hypothetical protein